MESIIKKFDFQKTTEESKYKLMDQLDAKRSELSGENMKKSEIEAIFKAYKEKVCVKGYPARLTEAYEVADVILREMVDEKKISLKDSHAIHLDLFVNLLKAGPGTTHCELLGEVTYHLEFDEYLKNVEGEALTRVVEAFKSVSYTPEKEIDLEEFVSTLNREYPRALENLLGDEDSERLHKAEIKKMFLDLYFFFLKQMPNMPKHYEEILGYAKDRIWYAYDRNPFQDLKDVGLVKSQMSMMQTFVCHPDFPQSEKVLEEACDTMKYVLDVVHEETMILEVYDDVLQLLKAVCLNPNAPKFHKLIDCMTKIGDVSRQLIESHPGLFEVWAPVAAEILDRAPRVKEIGIVITTTSYEFNNYAKPKKSGYEKLWIPVVMGMIKWMKTTLMKSAQDILKEDRWKRVWNWKENPENAKKIVNFFLKADYPKTKDDSVEGLMDKIAAVVTAVIDQLTILKVAHLIEVDVTELAMMSLEKHDVKEMCDLSREICTKVSLKKNKKLIPGYLARFCVLLKNEDLPWENGLYQRAGFDFVECLIQTLQDAKEDTTPDIDEKFTEIFLYSMEEEREFINIEDGDFNIHGMLAGYGLIHYVQFHAGRNSLEKIQPLLSSIQRLMGCDEEQLAGQMNTVMALIGNKASDLINTDKSMGNMIDLYIKNLDVQLLVSLESAYENCPEEVAAKFPELIKTFTIKDSAESSSIVMQSLLLRKVAENQPELFTPDLMKLLFDHQYMNKTANNQVLIYMEMLSKTRPELFEPFVVSHLTTDEQVMKEMASYLMNILVRVAAKCESQHQNIYDYFAAKIKKSNNEHVLYAMVQGLREMLDICGTEIFTQEDKDCVEGLKTKAPTKYIKDVAEDLINELAGRSLEKVSKDVEGHTEGIGKLNVGLAGTKVVVKRVQKDVKKQKKEVEKVKEGLGEVNERVDDVEADVEEVKEKVEEVDKKTMSNAPTWSRDVTKLMNPESEHDWRLLASRLGYSPDDIRGWATQSDPCMALLSEWYATHKTFEASRGVLNVLQEMNRLDAAAIVENAMKAAEGVVADEPVDYPEPPEVFLSYQWGHQNEVKLIHRHLEMAGYKCWMDVGQMGGGDKLFEKIDIGIRAAKIVICCVTEKYAKSPNCNREVNLSVNLGKPMIPLLIEKMAWPPAGSMGPIFSEYLFIRFFQRPGEETKDDRIWPAAKFTELLMQMNCLKVMPDETIIDKRYKNWWIPVVEEIAIPKKGKQNKTTGPIQPAVSNDKETAVSPEVFISYQWGKQKEISALYQRLTGLGLTSWMDIHQMGGGDSLYDKIDRGIRGCKVVVCSVTTKYSFSANCRREVSLADALKKPIIPMLMEKIDWPPSGPMSMVLTQLLYINFSKDQSVQKTWKGQQFDELLSKIREHVPEVKAVNAKAPQKTSTIEKSENKTSTNQKQGQNNSSQSGSPAEETRASAKQNPAQNQSDGIAEETSNTINNSSHEEKPSEKTSKQHQPPPKEEKKSSTCILL